MKTSPTMSPNHSSAHQLVEDCGDGFVAHSPSSSYIISSIAACVVNTAVVVSGTILNSFVLFIFLRSRQMRRKLAYFLIMVLLSIDLGMVTIVPSLFLVQSVNEILETPRCLYSIFYEFFALTLTGMSTTTLFVMNIERYLSIVHPFFHRTRVTKRKCMLILIPSWIIITFTSPARLIGSLPTYANLAFSVVFDFVIFSSLFAYLSIFYVARKSLLKVDQQINDRSRETSRSPTRFLRELKMAKTYLCIISLCFTCYLPAAVFAAVWTPWKIKTQTRNILSQAYPWMIVPVALNSTLNCLVFFWANRELRREGFKAVKQCFTVRRDSWNQ